MVESSKIIEKDLSGLDYIEMLRRIHNVMKPANYLEIGTKYGDTLALSDCNTIGIDPNFQISNPEVFSRKTITMLYQMTSDDFFAKFDIRTIFGSPIQLSFLDGMHRCEFLLRDFYNTEMNSSRNSVIAIHDCLPTEMPMTSRRDDGIVAIKDSRSGWWTGDVWRTALLLKRDRPDLEILSLDAYPTGLLLITNLDPKSSYLKENYRSHVKKMMSYDLSAIGFEKFYEEMGVVSTSVIDMPEKMTTHFNFY
ncbi:hypothetical protein MPPM_3987 [Methylorubrum populi]|uniref:Class I SAM-dependent methyltransferase n=1 Tax=Methylorubrum populi TaxID=223967 RepID=A0A169RBP9_9HYPH|nr:class I SAM-dependent methyltransferase [Methylorubrum populi]BAU92592.1 hypothetical protein MPPM_3987 [Methylorubrum populi]